MKPNNKLKIALSIAAALMLLYLSWYSLGNRYWWDFEVVDYSLKQKK
jgi:hypothetical protein